MKSPEEIVKILRAYDETRNYRAAARISGCDHQTVRRYVELRGLDHAMAEIRKTCRFCGNDFQARNQRAIYCPSYLSDCKRKAARAKRVARHASGDDRRCPRCQRVLPVTEFKPGAGYCKPCSSSYNKERARTQRRSKNGVGTLRLKRYGLTVEIADTTWDAQGESCSICKTREPGGHGSWHIDHDHSCHPGEYGCASCFRGFLCHGCNTGLGCFRDDPIILQAATDYVLRNRV